MVKIEEILKTIKELKFNIPLPEKKTGKTTSILTPRPLSELK